MALSREGKERSFRENLVLAHTLPGVAGMVNAIGYVELGFYTAHMTGRVGGLAINSVKGHLETAFELGALFLGFFGGAILASVLIELARRKRWPRFALPLLIEALLLAVILLFEVMEPTALADAPWSHRMSFGVALAMSMGLQNALIARLSGAVIRTTHLTGVTTDLGSEIVRVILLYRERAKDAQSAEAQQTIQDSQLYRVRLYVTILVTFCGGAFIGAFAATHMGAFAMIAPIVVVVGLVIYDRVLAVSEEDVEEHFNPVVEAKHQERMSRRPEPKA